MQHYFAAECASFVGYFQHPMVERVDKETDRSNIGSCSFGRGRSFYNLRASVIRGFLTYSSFHFEVEVNSLLEVKRTSLLPYCMCYH